MPTIYPDQFLGLAPRAESAAHAVILPLPLERTVSYGSGTWKAPRAIIDASCQVETFDEETLVDFEAGLRIHTAPAIVDDSDLGLEPYLESVASKASTLRDKFVLGLGGEHTVTYGLIKGLVPDLSKLTVVQIDAHADLMQELDGRFWSHGTVMRRVRDLGARLIQVGVRSLSRSEYEFAMDDEGITTFFAHELERRWEEALEAISNIEGDVYLTLDVDGLDPSVIPSTGTPQPDGLSWPMAMRVIRTIAGSERNRFIGADVVEFVASPHPPGCDIIAARLAAKILAFRFAREFGIR